MHNERWSQAIIPRACLTDKNFDAIQVSLHDNHVCSLAICFLSKEKGHMNITLPRELTNEVKHCLRTSALMLMSCRKYFHPKWLGHPHYSHSLFLANNTTAKWQPPLNEAEKHILKSLSNEWPVRLLNQYFFFLLQRDHNGQEHSWIISHFVLQKLQKRKAECWWLF